MSASLLAPCHAWVACPQRERRVHAGIIRNAYLYIFSYIFVYFWIAARTVPCLRGTPTAREACVCISKSKCVRTYIYIYIHTYLYIFSTPLAPCHAWLACPQRERRVHVYSFLNVYAYIWVYIHDYIHICVYNCIAPRTVSCLSSVPIAREACACRYSSKCIFVYCLILICICFHRCSHRAVLEMHACAHPAASVYTTVYAEVQNTCVTYTPAYALVL